MRKPRLKLLSDDDMSMNSLLEVKVCNVLNRIQINHLRQGGSEEIIYLFPEQVDKLVKFLNECNEWILSGYKEELRPTSYSEGGTEYFKE
jgi:hypothetical protein